MDNVLGETQRKMRSVLEIIRADLATVRTGRATPSLVENIVIKAYGGAQKLKLMEMATIATSDSQTLVISPYDKSVLDEIARGIMEANIGLTPSSDGNVIRINIPPLSEERRQELIRVMKQKLENGRIQIRQVRHEAMDIVKKQFTDKEISQDDLTRLEKEIQKATDDTMAAIEAMRERKEEELLQI
ncbi:MAG: hypothetical protein ACD_50C00343G0010 [uncultured bacterium]|nr:MAG: hypothetical protein ACD_50C00343G0010 [uncultured bacterium]OGH13260.1 MAG: ribosome recycling factor [Candidatus Levybacteria bacterium RIFCSPHIGHO2_01_FULL_38_26]